MRYAAAEQCLVQDHTSEALDGHVCRGVCGGRLHGYRVEVEDPDSDEPIHASAKHASFAKATTIDSSSASMSTSVDKHKIDDTRGCERS